jgi:hypothetical protein
VSKLYDLRSALKAHLVDEELFAEDSIIIKRQTDIWNDIAVAIASTVNSVAVVIGVAEGSSADDDELVMELTVPVTILCPPSLEEGALPEEDLWEAMVKAVHGFVVHPSEHCQWEFKFRNFSDDVELGDNAAQWLARQTVFRVRQNF